MSLLIDESVVPVFQVHSTTPPSSPPEFTPSPTRTTTTRISPPIDVESLLDIDSVLDDADRFLGGRSPSVIAHAGLPNTAKVAIHHQTPPSSIAASTPTKRRVTFWETPTSQKWSDGATPQPLPSSKKLRGLIPKPILKQRSPPAVYDPRKKMAEALKALATDNVDNILAQYNGLQDVLRMVDTCPEIETLFTTSKKELLRFVARDMVVRAETTQVQLNMARNVIEFLPLLVNRLGFEDGVKQECGKILDHSLDYLEIPESSFTEKPGQTVKVQRSHGFQLSNLTRLHLQFWTCQTLTNSLTEQHVRRINAALERHWKKAEEAAKARDEDPTKNVENPYEKASSVQARLHVLQKLLHQVPGLMLKDAKRWLVRLLEETINPRHPQVRKIATDIGIATASDMGSRKEVAQAMLSIMTHTSKSKDRNYVQRRIVCLQKRLNGKDIDKDLVPDSWVFPLLYMQHPDVQSHAWSQLAAYRDVLKDCFKTDIPNRKLACWEALRKLISAEFGTGYSTQRLQDFWQWLENWIPTFFEKATEDEFKNPLFVSSVYTYFRVLQKAVPATHWQLASDVYLDQVWEICVVNVLSKMGQSGTTRTHKILACRILASLLEKLQADSLADIWAENEEFGAGLKNIQPLNVTWVRSRLPQILEVVLPFLEYDIVDGDGRKQDDELRVASTRMWAALLQTVSNTHNTMDFTSSSRKEFKKVMAHITNQLTSLWNTTASSPRSDVATAPFFSVLFAAVDILEPSNFAQNHIFSINGRSCDASTPSSKGSKAQSASLHLSAVMVKSLFAKAKLCDNRNIQSSLVRLWSLCMGSRNSRAEKLEYLRSLSESIHSVIQREGKADAGCKQGKLVFTPILKLATEAFLTSSNASSSIFDRPSYDHTQRIVEEAFGCTTPNTKQMQDLYSAMVSSIKADTASLNKTKPVDPAYVAPTGDTAVAIVLTAPYAKLVLRHLNDTRAADSQPTQKFLLEFSTIIVRHDRRLTSRVEFKNARALFESANERLVAKTIEQHLGDFHRTVSMVISTLYDQDKAVFKTETLRMLAELVDTLIDHVRSTPAQKQSILTFIQKGVSVLVRDDSSKVAAKSALAEKIEHLWKLAGDRMVTEISSNKQKWLKEHDDLLAAGISSPRLTICAWAHRFWNTQFDKADIVPGSEVAKALDRPQIVEPVVPAAPAPTEEPDEDNGSDSSDEEHALPKAATSPMQSAAVRSPVKQLVRPVLDTEIPSSPPVQPARQYLSPKKQTARSLFDTHNNSPDHIPSTPILTPGLDEENVPSSPIISSERRRSTVSHNSRSQASIRSPRSFAQNENVPSSPPAATSPIKTHRGAVIQIREDDDVPSSDPVQSSAVSEPSQPVKRGRGRPRKSDGLKSDGLKSDGLKSDGLISETLISSTELPSKARANEFVTAYKWRNRFHAHRPHISSIFQDHDPNGSSRYWMATASEFHKNNATKCSYIEKAFGCAPFQIWTTDCAPSHWSPELIQGVAELATVVKQGADASEVVTQVEEARNKRIADSQSAITRITVEDVEEVLAELREAELREAASREAELRKVQSKEDDLREAQLTPTEPARKRKRVTEAEVTSSQPRRKRNQSTPSESQGSQEPTSSRYSTRARSGPSKETSITANVKIRPERTPRTASWRGWVVVSESPEPQPEEVRLPDARKLRSKRKPDQDKLDGAGTPSIKRRKLDAPSTPTRSETEIRSDPVVNVTPGDPTGRNQDQVVHQKHRANKEKTPKEAGSGTTSISGSKTGSEDRQCKGSPSAWIQKFKDLLTDIPMFLWRPRDQQEVQDTFNQVWEKVREDKSGEEEE
ncbi:hypothetical protein BLS_006441 [Venturia inaequalis]|uniref:Telomere-associated protein Rif1 N-terminal domain-containing protein n=1 Tax=Venturia inaequalis TaxID=5025 RepID=A0A8H3UDK9_VENIN|nr:hypothetical protein BLS_006441 [Venturia inaequalis]